MITDVWLGALLATTLALALTVTAILTLLAWLWSKLRRFKKLWIEQDKGIRFGGDIR